MAKKFEREFKKRHNYYEVERCCATCEHSCPPDEGDKWECWHPEFENEQNETMPIEPHGVCSAWVKFNKYH